MGPRALLFLLAVVAATALVLAIVGGNAAPVVVRLPLFEPMQVELWKVMFASGAGGVVFALAFDLAGRLRRRARGRRVRSGERDHEEAGRLVLQGVGEMASGRLEDALQSLERSLDLRPDDPDVLLHKAECEMRLERPGDAARTLGRILEDEPGNRAASYRLAEAYVAMSRSERAREVLERIIADAPETAATAMRMLRDLLVADGEPGKALVRQQQLIPLLDGEEREKGLRRLLELRHEYARSLLRAGEPEEAAREFRVVLDEDPGFVPAWVRLGEAYLAAGNRSAAVTTWERGFEVTGAVAPLAALQDHYLEQTRAEEAISVWKNAIGRSPNDAEARYLLGRLYDRLFMLDDALKTFANLAGRRAPALNARLSRILEGRGDLAEALSHAREVARAQPSLTAEYRCSRCRAPHQEWADSCGECRAYDSLRLDLGAGEEGGREEDGSAPEMAASGVPSGV